MRCERKRRRRRNSLDKNRRTGDWSGARQGRKGIVCVPVWQHGGGDVSRVPQYTKVLRFSTATIQGGTAVSVSHRAKVPQSPSESKSIVFFTELSSTYLGPR